MAIKKVGIALPEEVLNDIDKLTEENFSNRSHTIVRVWLEWKALKAQQGASGKPATDLLPNPNLTVAA